MSESTITITAEYPTIENAVLIEKLFCDGEKIISQSSESGELIFIHNYLDSIGKTMGVDFESWWIPIKITRIGSDLELRLIGSPSVTKEQDIVTWLKLSGARAISGKLLDHSGENIEVNQL